MGTMVLAPQQFRCAWVMVIKPGAFKRWYAMRLPHPVNELKTLEEKLLS